MAKKETEVNIDDLPEVNSLPSAETVTITRAELEALKNGKSELKVLVEGLAQAIQDSRKPYVSEGQLENEKNFQKMQREQAERLRRNLEADRENCPHIRGCNPLSDEWDTGNKTSFLRHRLDTGAIILMCTNCQKVVWPDDKDYAEHFRKKSGNRMSGAGDRQFADPLAVQKAGR